MKTYLLFVGPYNGDLTFHASYDERDEAEDEARWQEHQGRRTQIETEGEDDDDESPSVEETLDAE